MHSVIASEMIEAVANLEPSHVVQQHGNNADADGGEHQPYD